MTQLKDGASKSHGTGGSRLAGRLKCLYLVILDMFSNSNVVSLYYILASNKLLAHCNKIEKEKDDKQISDR